MTFTSILQQDWGHEKSRWHGLAWDSAEIQYTKVQTDAGNTPERFPGLLVKYFCLHFTSTVPCQDCFLQLTASWEKQGTLGIQRLHCSQESGWPEEQSVSKLVRKIYCLKTSAHRHPRTAGLPAMENESTTPNTQGRNDETNSLNLENSN